jgi:hypoxanthine phosphoribosyltransferase
MDTEFTELPVYFYGYHDIESFCLSQRASLAREGIGVILGVMRGGGIPALMLSQMLGIPVDFVYYDRREAKAEIRSEKAFELIASCVKAGQKILLVEDIAGVGQTLIDCYEYVRAFVDDAASIKVLALVHHENSRTKPDYGKDCAGVRAILPWERYVTSRLCLEDFLKAGRALPDDQRYKKTLAIDDATVPLDLELDWPVDHRLACDGDDDSILKAIRMLGPEEIYCNSERLIALILEKLPFAIVYKVIDRKRYRIIAVD